MCRNEYSIIVVFLINAVTKGTITTDVCETYEPAQEQICKLTLNITQNGLGTLGLELQQAVDNVKLRYARNLEQHREIIRAQYEISHDCMDSMARSLRILAGREKELDGQLNIAKIQLNNLQTLSNYVKNLTSQSLSSGFEPVVTLTTHLEYDISNIQGVTSQLDAKLSKIKLDKDSLESHYKYLQQQNELLTKNILDVSGKNTTITDQDDDNCSLQRNRITMLEAEVDQRNVLGFIKDPCNATNEAQFKELKSQVEDLKNQLVQAGYDKENLRFYYEIQINAIGRNITKLQTLLDEIKNTNVKVIEVAVKLSTGTYLFNKETPKNWHLAREYCLLRGMDLIAIESEREYQAVSAHALKIGGSFSTDYVMTSGCYNASRRAIIWQKTDSPVTYTNWWSSNYRIKREEHYCIAFKPSNFKSWIEANIDGVGSFICEQ